MPNEPSEQSRPKPRATAPKPRKDSKDAEELLREQSKTETEQRPYLDTEGGE